MNGKGNEFGILLRNESANFQHNRGLALSFYI